MSMPSLSGAAFDETKKERKKERKKCEAICVGVYMYMRMYMYIHTCICIYVHVHTFNNSPRVKTTLMTISTYMTTLNKHICI